MVEVSYVVIVANVLTSGADVEIGLPEAGKLVDPSASNVNLSDDSCVPEYLVPATVVGYLARCFGFKCPVDTDVSPDEVHVQLWGVVGLPRW